MKYLNNFFLALLSKSPYYFTIILFSAVLKLFIFSLFHLNSYQSIIASIISFITAWYFLRQRNKSFVIKKIELIDVLILSVFIFVLIIRFPLYFPAYDDIAYHMIAGDYSRFIWNNNLFMPLNFATYLYPVYQSIYTPLLHTLGIRATLLVVNLTLIFWYFSLYVRFKEKTNKNVHFWLTLLFPYIFFVPHLMATHITFMVDFVSVILLFEFYFQLKHGKDKTFAFSLALLFLVIKQASGIFVLPFIAWQCFKNINQINKKLLLLFASIIAIYFIQSYINTGNPLSFLFNGLFKSPLYDIQNFRDTRWGPIKLWEYPIWPIIGQFTQRYAEGLVSMKSQMFFSLFIIFPYIFGLYKLIFKKQIVYIVIPISYMFWAIIIGYARYHIPLTAILWLWIIDSKEFKVPFFVDKYKNIIIIFFLLIIINFIKVDFSWRPVVFNEGFSIPYKQGIDLLFKDTIPNIAKSVNDRTLKSSAVVVFQNRGPQIMYAYLAYKNNKSVINYVDMKTYKRIMNSQKISSSIKKSLSIIKKSNNVLFVTDTKSNNNTFMSEYGYACSYLDEIGPNNYFQNGYVFNGIFRYTCTKLIK